MTVYLPIMQSCTLYSQRKTIRELVVIHCMKEEIKQLIFTEMYGKLANLKKNPEMLKQSKKVDKDVKISHYDLHL